MIKSRQRHGKGPFAGPFLLSCFALSACARGNPALHDTYFVVHPVDAMFSLAIVAGSVLMAWVIISFLSERPPIRLRAGTLAAFIVGGALTLAPLLPTTNVNSIMALNRVANFGGSVAGLALLVTAVVLVWTLIATLLRKL